MTAGRARLGAGLALGLALAVVGCGYSTSRLVEAPGVQTVAVAQFDNRTYRRDLEQRFTKILAEEVRARTPWRVASVGSADAVLEGAIEDAEAPILSEEDDQARTPIAQRYRVRVKGQLTDRRTGRVIRSFDVTSFEAFAPGSYGETEDASATDTVLGSAARSVVHALERPIGDPARTPPGARVHPRNPFASEPR
ncbi:MAG: hypothetical protein IT460_16060 [Planctomycetes bacterium]|nr:hypothetical protein [Planctomycetota bacterium]